MISEELPITIDNDFTSEHCFRFKTLTELSHILLDLKITSDSRLQDMSLKALRHSLKYHTPEKRASRIIDVLFPKLYNYIGNNTTIEYEYKRAKNPPLMSDWTYFSFDIFEHLDTLREYSKGLNHITEFGVREVVSTLSFLVDDHDMVISYDCIKTDRIDFIQMLCKNEDKNWVFHKKSTLDVEIENTELLFIDTLHTYDQLIQELRIHSKKVSKYILIHDIISCGEVGQGGSGSGLYKAIIEFLSESKEWNIKELRKNCNGLLVLERLPNVCS